MIILIHYAEIGTKGQNRPFFERRLEENVRTALKRAGIPARTRRMSGRIIADVPDSTRGEQVSEILAAQFGISSYAFVAKSESDIQSLERAAKELVAPREGTFRISARRADKRYPHSSQEINELVGEYVMNELGRKVNLTKPDVTCRIEVTGSEAFLYTEKLPGPGGLPVGTGGKVLVLLSGGIDSPVAAYFAARRGLAPHYIHFHAYPYTDREGIKRTGDIANILTAHQPETTLHFVPFAELQKEIVASRVPERLRLILYRRFMLRIAERIAQKIGAQALVTGDVVGQVASQTLENMATISDVTRLLVLRPLVGFDKADIIARAERIGTYAASIRGCEDTCSRFVPAHPALQARLSDVAEAERCLDVERLVADAVSQSEAVRVTGEK